MADLQADIQIDLPMEQIAAFCQRWKITEFALFGSVLRDDFRPDSDIDVLVTFAPDSGWSLFDRVDMLEELRAIFGRGVDLINRQTIEEDDNYFIRKAILNSARSIYAA